MRALICYHRHRAVSASLGVVSFQFSPERIPVSDTPAVPVPPTPPLRRDEEIALEMMKFVATTTGFGRTGTPGAGFQGGTVSRAEDYAKHLIDLYGQCLDAVKPKR
jgi:hypothetical protein